MSAALLEAVRTLAARRAAVAALKGEWAAIEARVKAEHAALLDQLAQAQAALAETEAAVRSAAVAVYQATGERRPASGVEVKLYTRLVYDEAAALAWAIEHRLCLALDKPAFERLAGQPRTRPPFVAEVQTPRAAIATDLAAALGEVAS